jgi:hypothetical protein
MDKELLESSHIKTIKTRSMTTANVDAEPETEAVNCLEKAEDSLPMVKTLGLDK